MSRISTHVLDTVKGRPAAGVAVRLEARQGDGWSLVAEGRTDADGRCSALAEDAGAGDFRLIFLTADYWQEQGRTSIYPEIAVTFHCSGEGHYHLPVLLSDNSYTTYRGS
ncbi:MAG TPA: hydroxyisourate hydrolase [Terracidiphilus sp.]|nr:hydroxyisourate hydrolase [Terracidiphilus sp.]